MVPPTTPAPIPEDLRKLFDPPAPKVDAPTPPPPAAVEPWDVKIAREATEANRAAQVANPRAVPSIDDLEANYANLLKPDAGEVRPPTAAPVPPATPPPDVTPTVAPDVEPQGQQTLINALKHVVGDPNEVGAGSLDELDALYKYIGVPVRDAGGLTQRQLSKDTGFGRAFGKAKKLPAATPPPAPEPTAPPTEAPSGLIDLGEDFVEEAAPRIPSTPTRHWQQR